MARSKAEPIKKGANKPSPIEKKKRKWKPGTVALREIRRYQRQTEAIVPRAAFGRVVRDIAGEYAAKGAIRFQADSLDALQNAAEDYLVDIYKKAQTFALHSKRVTISKDDFKLAVEQLVGVES